LPSLGFSLSGESRRRTLALAPRASAHRVARVRCCRIGFVFKILCTLLMRERVSPGSRLAPSSGSGPPQLGLAPGIGATHYRHQPAFGPRPCNVAFNQIIIRQKRNFGKRRMAGNRGTRKVGIEPLRQRCRRIVRSFRPRNRRPHPAHGCQGNSATCSRSAHRADWRWNAGSRGILLQRRSWRLEKVPAGRMRRAAGAYAWPNEHGLGLCGRRGRGAGASMPVEPAPLGRIRPGPRKGG